MVKKRDDKKQKTLAQFFNTSSTPSSSTRSTTEAASVNNRSKTNSKNNSSKSPNHAHATKRKSVENIKSPSSLTSITTTLIIDDPIEVDDDDDDVKIVATNTSSSTKKTVLDDDISSCRMGSSIYHYKPLSSTFDAVKQLPDAPKRTQLYSLAYTPVGCTCVHPYNPHFSHDAFFQHAHMRAQPPTPSQLFYRRLTGIPLPKHVAQVYERQETQQWFKNKPQELARLVDMSDTQATEYVTCMDVCGNSLVYGTHKGNITMCNFLERERHFKHSFYDSRISNVMINPYLSDELAVSALSTTSGSLCLFDMSTGKMKSTVLNDSVLNFEYRDSNILILSKKNGKIDIQDVRSKKKKSETKSISTTVASSSTSSASKNTTPLPVSPVRTPAQGVGVLVAKKSSKKKTTIQKTSTAMFYSDPFDSISIDKTDSNYIYGSSFHSMDLKIFDLRKSLNDCVVNINVSSCIQDLDNRLGKSISSVVLLPMKASLASEFRTETGLQITEVTRLSRGPKQTVYNTTPSKGIKSFGTTKSGYIHFLTTSGGVGLLDPLTKRVSKYYEDSRTFSLGSFGQKGDIIENDNGMFILAPYGPYVQTLDWSRPKVDEWETLDNTTRRYNSSDETRTMRLSCKGMYAGTCKNNLSQLRVMNPHTPHQKIICSEFDNRLVYFE